MYLLHPTAPPTAMLHSVSDATHPALANWYVSRKAFLRLLDVIQAAGLTTTHFAEIVEAKASPASFAGKIILSFDDGYKELFDFAIPELVKRAMKAVFYIPSAYVGGYNRWDEAMSALRLDVMDEQDLRALVSLGMEVGSHGHRHLNLNAVSKGQAQEETHLSKQLLEAITARPVYSFAYPYGAVPAGYKNLLLAAGYQYGVSIYQRVEKPLALRRFGIYEKDTLTTINRKLSGRYRWMRTMYDMVKRY